VNLRSAGRSAVPIPCYFQHPANFSPIEAASVQTFFELGPFDVFLDVVAAWVGRFFDGFNTPEVRDGRCWLRILPACFLSAARKALRIRVHNPFSQNLLK
jgi:hypothetical protein